MKKNLKKSFGSIIFLLFCSSQLNASRFVFEEQDFLKNELIEKFFSYVTFSGARQPLPVKKIKIFDNPNKVNIHTQNIKSLLDFLNQYYFISLENVTCFIDPSARDSFVAEVNDGQEHLLLPESAYFLQADEPISVSGKILETNREESVFSNSDLGISEGAEDPRYIVFSNENFTEFLKHANKKIIKDFGAIIKKHENLIQLIISTMMEPSPEGQQAGPLPAFKHILDVRQEENCLHIRRSQSNRHLSCYSPQPITFNLMKTIPSEVFLMTAPTTEQAQTLHSIHQTKEITPFTIIDPSRKEPNIYFSLLGFSKMQIQTEGSILVTGNIDTPEEIVIAADRIIRLTNTPDICIDSKHIEPAMILQERFDQSLSKNDTKIEYIKDKLDLLHRIIDLYNQELFPLSDFDYILPSYNSDPKKDMVTLMELNYDQLTLDIRNYFYELRDFFAKIDAQERDEDIVAMSGIVEEFESIKERVALMASKKEALNGAAHSGSSSSRLE